LWSASASILLFSTLAIACKRADRTKWVDPAELHPGPIQHASLTDNQLERVRRLQQTFAEVDPSSLDKWIDDFKRDRDPERELRVYEGMADAYRAYCNGRNLSPRGKSDVYQVVLLRSGAPDEEVLPHLKLDELSVADAKQILGLYKEPAAPITAVPSSAGR
jgi:hypothetical protein